jgi:hypothetical protein
MSQSYKHTTKHFKIPIPGYRDTISPELEMMKWQIVENMILAAMRGNVNAIFREGDLRIRKESNGTYTILMVATGNEPSVQGAVAGAFFDAPNVMEWNGLKSGSAYYLYIKGSDKTFQDSRAVVTLSSERRLDLRFVTLVAKVDLAGENPEIDRNPPGKVNARDLAQHVTDWDNPHGENLIQDQLLVREKIAIGDGNDADLELDVNGEVSTFKVSRLVSTLKTENIIVDFVSGGMKGVVLTVKGRVLFVNVVRIKTMNDTKEMGELMIGFHGLHTDVESPDKIIVWNKGEEGIPMRAMITCES